MLIIFNCLTINVLSVIPNGFFFFNVVWFRMVLFYLQCWKSNSEWYYFIYNVVSVIQNVVFMFSMLSDSECFLFLFPMLYIWFRMGFFFIYKCLQCFKSYSESFFLIIIKVVSVIQNGFYSLISRFTVWFRMFFFSLLCDSECVFFKSLMLCDSECFFQVVSMIQNGIILFSML
jgi:hypothetical protein